MAIKEGLGNRKMRFTHLEVDPFTILGVVGGVIPVRTPWMDPHISILFSPKLN
jgi:hypothetical protein